MKFYTNVSRIGNYICVREIKNGKKKLRKIHYKPSVFVKSKNVVQEFKNLDGQPLEEVKFASMQEANKYIKQYRDVHSFPIYGQKNYINDWITKNYPNKVQFDQSLLRVVALDIETECENGFPNIRKADQKINLIGLKVFGEKKRIIFGWGDYHSTDENNEFVKCDDEKHLLQQFLEFWSSNYPDIVTGWAIEMFDIPYIINRTRVVLGEEYVNFISPWEKIQEREFEMNGEIKQGYNILGISCLDYMAAYKKFILTPRESYKLNDIAMDELGYGKVDYSGSLKDLYTNDYQKFVDYNIRDFQLIEDLDNKLQIIKLSLFIAYDSHVNYEDVLYQVRCWNSRIINELEKDKILTQINRERPHKNKKFTGAFVKTPKPGKYQWLVGFDVASLYPNIMRALNMGFETKVLATHELREFDMLNNTIVYQRHKDYALKNNCTVSANGVFYKKDRRSYYHKLLTDLFNQRIEFKRLSREYERKINVLDVNEKQLLTDYKQKMAEYGVFDKSVKVCLNSNYGAIGNAGFIFFDVDNAEAVTITGRVIIQTVAREMNKIFNKLFGTIDIDYVALIDTDSVRFDSLINVNGTDMRIDDYFDNCNGKLIKNDDINQNYIKKISDDVTLCSDGKSILERPINYIKKHKVKKVMYKIKVDGREVIVTEDHSIMVERDGKLISVKAKNILSDDIILYK